MTPTGTASTSCSTRSPAPPSAPASNYWPSVDDSSRSANATSTATPGWGCSRSGATSRSTPSTWGCWRISHPDRLRDLLTTVYQLTADGSLPMPECTHYPLADAATAIRAMSGAQHTGKLVLDVPRTGAAAWWCHRRRSGSSAATAPTSSPAAWAAWGCSWPRRWQLRAAGRIVLSSRSQPTVEALEMIERIRAIGADVVVECGDIAEPDTAQRLVATATATGLPVRGVLHAAAVIEDATLTNITDELIERDWAPKVYGAWNLHMLPPHQPLDWFCSFSSAAALVGSPGQGAYAAANSWLDAFTRWRRAQGLPATAIAWGAWAQIGRGTALAESADVAIAPERRRLRVRSVAAP